MGRVKVGGELIFLEQIEDDESLRERLKALNPGDTVDLDVGGVVGRWQRIAGEGAGRIADGIRPVGAMLSAWTGMWAEPGGAVRIGAAGATNGNPATFGLRLFLWDTPESQIR